MPLYQVAVVKHPTENEKKDGKGAELLLEPVSVLANDPQSAALQTGAKHKIDFSDEQHRMEVIVVPFE